MSKFIIAQIDLGSKAITEFSKSFEDIKEGRDYLHNVIAKELKETCMMKISNIKDNSFTSSNEYGYKLMPIELLAKYEATGWAKKKRETLLNENQTNKNETEPASIPSSKGSRPSKKPSSKRKV